MNLKKIQSEKMREVLLARYNPEWVGQFEEESVKIHNILQDNCHSIHHIGSTAIPGIYAKPVIDILPVVHDLSVVDNLNAAFERLGYVCMGELGIEGRRYYWKSKAKHTHHIHLFEDGNPEITRHVAFRDHMIQYPDSAQAYSWMKRCLAEQFPNDIEAYVNGKESFVRMIDYRAGVAKTDQLEARDDVSLVPYCSKWEQLAVAEINAIRETIELPYIAIEHLGSTAVNSLSAKPIIDIFIALDSIDEAEQWVKPLEALGYLYWASNPEQSHRRFFKGLPPFGLARTHHVHIMQIGDEFKRRVAFRNLLRQDATTRKQYEVLKQQLAGKYPRDRESYTAGKGEFIREMLKSYKHDE